MRALMGRKYYSVLNYHWTDAGPVEDFINKCLCYAVFGTNIRKTDPQYVDNPDGYWRDKALLDWFIPLVRLLHRAGWEPVTCAHVDGERVFLERFGSKDAVYFSLITESDHTEDCVLTIDFESLGFEPGEFSIGEIARGLPLESRGPGKVALRLEPLRTCIIALTKEQPFRSCLQ